MDAMRNRPASPNAKMSTTGAGGPTAPAKVPLTSATPIQTMGRLMGRLLGHLLCDEAGELGCYVAFAFLVEIGVGMRNRDKAFAA